MPGPNNKEADDFLKGLLQKPNSKGSPKYHMSSADELNEVVNTRFRKEMVVLFSRLSETYQCKILSAVQKKTHCSMPSLIKPLSNLTEMKHPVNVSCLLKGKMKLKEGAILKAPKAHSLRKRLFARQRMEFQIVSFLALQHGRILKMRGATEIG